MPLLTGLIATASGGAMALSGTSCSTTAAGFTGTEHPVLVSADDVVDFGVDEPEGHEVIGVASVRCETTNGASGLLEVPCDEQSMTALLRRRAAEAGGTGLVELECDAPDARRILQNVDGGSVQQSTLSGLVCHATVVRRREGVVVGAPIASSKSQQGAGRVVTLSGHDVEVGAEQPPRLPPSTEVGELAEIVEGYDDLGPVWARCVEGCARSVARRALLGEARRHGAQAIAELSCELQGERWRCSARMIGPMLSESVIEDAPRGAGGGQAAAVGQTAVPALVGGEGAGPPACP